MNEPSWFEAWARAYAIVFGLSPDELAVVFGWEDFFIASGFVAEDLDEATRVLSQDPGAMVRRAGEAKFLGKCPIHLAAIQSFMRDRRAVSYEREVETYEDRYGACPHCGGSGRVVVPLLAGVRDGEWVPLRVARGSATWYTAAVACSCRLGEWLNQRLADSSGKKQRQPLMTLGSYESKNPRWRIQMAARIRAQTAKVRIGNPKLAASLAAIMKRLGVTFTEE